MFCKYNILLFGIILTSCNNIPIPGTHIPLSALWSQTIDRWVKYTPEENKFLHDEIVEIKYSLSPSINAIFTKAPKNIIYENYANPFSLSIRIKLLNRNIEKIILTQCIVKNMNGDINNILDIPNDISIRFWWRSNDGNRGWSSSRDSNVIIDKIMGKIEIELGKRDTEYIEDINFYFTGIPINYKVDDEISIICEFDFINNDDQNNIFKYEIEYKRIIEELKMYHFIRNNKNDDELPHEITMEEWGNGLAFPLLRYEDD